MDTSEEHGAVKDQFKGFEMTKVRTPNLELLFSALKTIPPSSTEE